MKKKLLVCVMALAAVFTVTGCGEKKESTGSNNETTTTTKASKGNCSVIECMNKIKPENTVQEINDIMGFEGELKEEKYGKYEWKINETDSITATYYSSKTATITCEYDKKDIANDNLDFSKSSEIQTAVKSKDGLTYEQFIEMVGGIQGTLIESSSISKTYIWTKSNGAYVKGTFSNSSNKCTFFIGRV